MTTVTTIFKPWPLGAIKIHINGLLHFYACITDIKSIHAYIDNKTPEYKYTIVVLVNNTTINLQYDNKILSAEILTILDNALEARTN